MVREIIEPLLPLKKKTQLPKWTKRQILDGVLYQLKNGCNWQDLPKDLPPYKDRVLALQAITSGRCVGKDSHHNTFSDARTRRKKQPSIIKTRL